MLTRLAFIVLGVLAFTAASAAQTTITLRGSARLADGAQDVRLADIADLAGPDASTLGQMLICSDAQKSAGRDGVIPLTLDRVRTELEGKPGVNWGRIVLRGGTCKLAVAAAAATPSQAASDRKPRPDRRPDPAPIDLSGPPTLRTVIAQRLSAAYDVRIADLRLGFDQADAPLLAREIRDERIDVALGAAAGSARMPVTVTVYQADDTGEARIVLSRTMQADVLVNLPVVVAAVDLDKGRTLAAEQLSVETRWVPATSAGVRSLDEAVGLVTNRRIPAGQAIGREDAAAPLACKRGDTVFVHCLSGGVVLKVKAKALTSARDGESVKLRMDGSEEEFEARMSGRGRAVVTVK